MGGQEPYAFQLCDACERACVPRLVCAGCTHNFTLITRLQSLLLDEETQSLAFREQVVTHKATIDRLQRELADLRLSQRPAQTWHPLATAPKDGTFCLLGSSTAAPVIGYWSPIAGWVWADLMRIYPVPTHWMPLPVAPEED